MRKHNQCRRRYGCKILVLPLLFAWLCACGESGGDDPVAIAPSVPLKIRTIAVDGQVSISWNSVDRATSYNIYWNNSGGVTKADTKISNVTSPFVDPGYTNDTMYFYAVTAVNADGESSISSEGAAISTLMANVVFADTNLQTCVDGKGAMWSTDITELNCSNKNISDLSGLEKLTNLSLNLYLDGNNISNITSLSTLTNLRDLNIRNNNISDVTPLAALPNLIFLTAGNNNFSDLSQFSGFQTLSSLSLLNSGISDVSVLAAALPDLDSLHLGFNRIADLSQFSAFTRLYYLDLTSNGLSDISQLAPITNIISLGLSGNSISDLNQFSAFTHLNSLNLTNNGISDVSQIASLSNLLTLYLNDNTITSGVASLVSLTKVTSLNLAGNNTIACADLSTLVAALGSAVIEPLTCL